MNRFNFGWTGFEKSLHEISAWVEFMVQHYMVTSKIQQQHIFSETMPLLLLIAIMFKVYTGNNVGKIGGSRND